MNKRPIREVKGYTLDIFDGDFNRIYSGGGLPKYKLYYPS